MKYKLLKKCFTTINPGDIWNLYRSLYRGGGNTSSPKLVVRTSDLLIKHDSVMKQDMVYPDKTMGISFADSIDTLAKKKIAGWVWEIPQNTEIPEGLVFNIKDLDHPMLNVGRIMTFPDLTVKLTQLADLMKQCHVKIDEAGKIIKKYSDTTKKVS